MYGSAIDGTLGVQQPFTSIVISANFVGLSRRPRKLRRIETRRTFWRPISRLVLLLFIFAGFAIAGGIPTTTVLTSTANPATYGSGVTLIATVSPSAATGRITFYNGTTVLSTQPVSSGQALLFTTQLSGGSTSVRAYYSGDAVYAASSSASFSQVVNSLPGYFQAPVTIAQASGRLVVADFNGDGKADLAAEDVSVFLGNGDGTFQSQINDRVGYCFFPRTIATGDFNGDGKVDLAVGESCSGVNILLGNGDGTFQPAVNYGSGPGLPDIAVGDFNGDGNADLAVADTCYGGICNSLTSIMLGNGDGTFRSGTSYDLTGTVVIGDFNGDGKADLLSGGGVLFGNGNGTFENPRPLGTIPDVCFANCGIDSFAALPIVGDFNSDGKADLAIPAQQGQTVSVLIGNGDGTFKGSANYTVGQKPQAIAAGDFDGDGKVDIVVALSSGIAVLPGRGNGTFGPAVSYAQGTAGGYVQVGGFQGDGRVDVAFLTQNELRIMLNTAATADLTVTKSHIGNFTQGQKGVAYSITVSNIGTAATAGTVAITDMIPSGLSLGSMSGAGWTCAIATCTRADSLAMGGTYPPITVLVDVGLQAPTQVVNTAMVSGGGETNTTNDTATDPTQINISEVNQTITFTAPTDQIIGSPPVLLSATTSSGLVVSFISTTNAVCTVSGSTVTLVSIGTCSITATQGGNASFASAAPVTRSFAIKHSQTITFGELSDITLASPAFPIDATASSGLQIHFTSETPNVCGVSGTIVSPVAAGVCSITASQAGDGNFAAAAPVTQSFSVIGPIINAGGVVPLFSSTSTISPGSWISIYGFNLVSNSAVWNGNFQSATSLAGVSVTINGKNAYISSVTKGTPPNPDQINAEAPDDQTIGPVSVIVTSPLGHATSTVSLAQFSPSLNLLDNRHVAAIILTPDGTGAYGSGSYDILGPSGSFVFATRPVRTGETLVLYGTGFGPTDPTVLAGTTFSGAAKVLNEVTVSIGGIQAQTTFAGISSTGLYQFNLIMPSAPSGDQPVIVSVGGVQSPANFFVAVE